MRFRPCIDLHDGKVKQIVGSSLKDDNDKELVTNFEAEQPPAYFARMYQRDGLVGGHVIKLGQGNDAAALDAVQAYPGGLQVGGGITADNAMQWLENGAAKVIVTSSIFENGDISWPTLERLVKETGPEKLVLDLSCRKQGDNYVVVIDRWQTFTSLNVTPETLDKLSGYCSEYLIHAVDVEGKQQGIEDELIEKLAQWCPLPVTYAGGIKCMADLERIKRVGNGKIDATVGSALDIFGGTGLTYAEMVEFDKLNR